MHANSNRRRFKETRRIIVIDPGSSQQNSDDKKYVQIKTRKSNSFNFLNLNCFLDVRFKGSVNLQKFQSKWVENMKAKKRKSCSVGNSHNEKIADSEYDARKKNQKDN